MYFSPLLVFLGPQFPHHSNESPCIAFFFFSDHPRGTSHNSIIIQIDPCSLYFIIQPLSLQSPSWHFPMEVPISPSSFKLIPVHCIFLPPQFLRSPSSHIPYLHHHSNESPCISLSPTSVPPIPLVVLLISPSSFKLVNCPKVGRVYLTRIQIAFFAFSHLSSSNHPRGAALLTTVVKILKSCSWTGRKRKIMWQYFGNYGKETHYSKDSNIIMCLGFSSECSS